MTIGYIGLGKMGLAQVERLLEKKWRVVAWNRSPEPRGKAKKLGAEVAETLGGVCERLKVPRLVWLMVPAAAVSDVLKELGPHLSKGDTAIDGGNSFYKHSMRRVKELARRGIHFLDVGVSGGPSGARNGACLMIGGDKKTFEKHKALFQALSGSQRGLASSNEAKPRHEGDYAHVGKSGAGHFVKMVHNGIEYGMMQAIAEGFSILQLADSRRRYADQRRHHPPQSPLLRGGKERGVRFGLNLKQIAGLYNKGSVIESRLTGWLAKAYAEHGEDLKDISGEVAHSGEGQWTVETARELGVPVKVIKDSLDFRIKSKGHPSYTGQVVSALRNQFGGHEVKKRI